MGIQIQENKKILEFNVINSNVKVTTCESKIPQDQIDLANNEIYETDLCIVSIGRKACIENLGNENMKI